MNLRTAGSLAMAGCLLLGFASQAYADRYIVLYKKNAVPADAVPAAKAAGGRIVGRINRLGIAIADSDRKDFAVRMAADGRVKSVGIDPATAVPRHSSRRARVARSAPAAGPTAADDLFNSGLVWGVERVHAPQAWDAGATGSHDTVVAVIDTGIAWNHPDLAPNVLHAACYTSEGSVVGFDTTSGPCNPYPTLSDHGTHVAGTVAAAFGGGRVVGVGPELALASYNTFELIEDCGVCTFSSVRWVAMLDAAARGYEVINMSLGGVSAFGQGKGTNALATFVAAEKRVANAVVKAGTTIVAAAGNNGLDLNGIYINTPGGVPATVNVGATGIRPEPRYQPGVSYDVRAFYSDFGAAIDVVAPGGDCGEPDGCDAVLPNWFEYLVLSSIVAPAPGCGSTASCPIGYGWKGGTSMASPHAAGVVGLIRDEKPSLSAAKAAKELKRTAERLGDRQTFGHGMVDARAAVH